MERTVGTSPLADLQDALRKGKAQEAANIFSSLLDATTNHAKLGRTVGGILNELIDDFYVDRAGGFAAWLKNHPAEEAVEAAFENIEPSLERIEEWRRNLRDLAQERRSRRLRELIRGRDVKIAAEEAAKLVKSGTTAEGRKRQARLLGAILGSLDHDQQRVRQLLDRLKNKAQDAGFTAESWGEMERARAESQKGLSLSAMGQRELQWNRVHTDCVVQLTRALPGRSTATQPTEEEEQRFYDALHPVFAAWFRDPSVCDFGDVARIVREFCPTDPRETGPVEGVEDVAFLSMNPADRLTSVRVLKRLGEKRRLAQAVTEAFDKTEDPRAREMLLYLMGGLANTDFFPYLKRALMNKTLSRFHDVAVDALGRIGDQHSIDLLFVLLEQFARARVIDPPTRKRLAACLAALGRVARHPRTSESRRNVLVQRTLRSLPEDLAVRRAAVEHLCAFDPRSLTKDNQDRAVQIVVDALWSRDPRTTFEKPREGETPEFGFRQPLIDILVAMGPSCLPSLLEAASRRVAQFSGAYLALAEALSQIGDERALGLLQQMILTTLTTDMENVPADQREFYYDVAQNKYVPLTTDKVAHGLVYAVHKKCGAEGHALLKQIVQRLRSGHLPNPGPKTMTLLGEIVVGSGRGDADAGDDAGEAALRTHGLGVERPRENDDLKDLLKDIRGKGLFGPKTPKRVAACQEVAARGEIEAVGPLCDLLASKETVLRTAADTALTELLDPSSPPQRFRLAMFEVLEKLRTASGDKAQAIVQTLAGLDPTAPPLQPFLMRFLKTEADDKMKKRLAEVFREANLRLRPSGPGARRPEPAAPEGAAEEPEGDEEQPKRPDFENMPEYDKIALRQDYLRRRREWIDGGKQGDEPQRPPGL